MKNQLVSMLLFFFIGNVCAINTPTKNLYTENGLSSNFIRTIYSDKTGLVWIGTDTGLDSYDGLEVVTFNKRLKTPLKGAVQSVLSISYDCMWVGSEQGAFKFNKRENVITPVIFELQGINIRKISKTKKGDVYFGSDKGLYLYDSITNSAKPILLHPQFRSKIVSVNDIIEDVKGTLWLATFDGLYAYSTKSKKAYHFDIYKQNFSNNIRSLIIIDNILYLGTENGLYNFNTKTSTYQIIKGTENKFILSLAFDKKNKTIFLGTENEGVFCFEMNLQKLSNFQLNPQSVRSNLSIYALHISDNNLWVGTFTEGVKYFDLEKKKLFQSLDLLNTLGITVRSYYFDENGYKYIGSRDGFLIMNSRFEVENHFRTTENPLLDARVITTIYPFPGNKQFLLLGTYGGGAIVFDKLKKTFSNFSKYENINKGSVYKFQQGIHNDIWMATLDGLYRYNLVSKSLLRYNLSKLTGSNEVFSLYLDNQNKLWIGTKLGACYVDLQTLVFKQPAVLKNYKYQCTSIHSDKKNSIWFCFNKGGVLELNQNLSLRNWITTEIGLPENAPSSLVEDAFGNMWVGTQKGLFRISRQGEILPFGIDDGLNGVIFSPESGYKDKNNNLWWANEFGFITFSSKDSLNRFTHSNTIFTDIYINGIRYSADTLNYIKKSGEYEYKIEIRGKNNNNLTLRFATLNYHNTKMNRYSYKLEGIDKSWSKPIANNLIQLENLGVGEHKVLVLANNSQNKPIEITISISPYFYETTLFTIFLWVSIILVTFYFTRSYFLHLLRQIKAQFEDIKQNQSKNEPAVLKISNEKCIEITEKLKEYMLSEKPYLNPDLKQVDVSKVIGYPVHEISQVLNIHIKMNFPDYINSLRVEELKDCIANGKYPKYTVSAIAELCGFNSKTTFYRAFKKFTGVSPAEYFKEIKVE